MQKLLRRTAMAKRQAAHRAERRAQKARADFMRSNREERIELRKTELADIRAARTARREDWELGPLAPRRDVGDSAESYGTVHPRRISGVEVPKSMRTKYWTIVEQDRVVILMGRDKGKIGVVTDTDRDAETVTVRGFNLVDVAIPKWMRKVNGDPSPVRTVEAGIPLSSVRLVYPVPDPNTGIPRDVVVERMAVRKSEERSFNMSDWPPTWDRVIPGLNIVVPWPAREKPEEKDNDIDTLRIVTEESTWVPTLLRPPMPPSVIEELRNKYSKFRDRHDDEYIAKKMQEDAEKERQRKLSSMMTPLQELHAKQRRERMARGRPELTEDQLAKIGEAVVARRGVPQHIHGALQESSQQPLQKAPGEVVTVQMEGLKVEGQNRSMTA